MLREENIAIEIKSQGYECKTYTANVESNSLRKSHCGTYFGNLLLPCGWMNKSKIYCKYDNIVVYCPLGISAAAVARI